MRRGTVSKIQKKRERGGQITIEIKEKGAGGVGIYEARTTSKRPQPSVSRLLGCKTREQRQYKHKKTSAMQMSSKIKIMLNSKLEHAFSNANSSGINHLLAAVETFTGRSTPTMPESKRKCKNIKSTVFD